jgi:hypothetical protein
MYESCTYTDAYIHTYDIIILDTDALCSQWGPEELYIYTHTHTHIHHRISSSSTQTPLCNQWGSGRVIYTHTYTHIHTPQDLIILDTDALCSQWGSRRSGDAASYIGRDGVLARAFIPHIFNHKDAISSCNTKLVRTTNGKFLSKTPLLKDAARRKETASSEEVVCERDGVRAEGEVSEDWQGQTNIVLVCLSVFLSVCLSQSICP